MHVQYGSFQESCIYVYSHSDQIGHVRDTFGKLWLIKKCLIFFVKSVYKTNIGYEGKQYVILKAELKNSCFGAQFCHI